MYKHTPDTFMEFLPAMLASPHPVDEYYGTDQLATYHAQLYKDKLEAAALLPPTNGTSIVALVSSDKDNAFNWDELEENQQAAEQLIRVLRNLGVDNHFEIVSDFSREDVESVLDDEGVGHLMFIGHTKRSGAFVPGDPILWRNTEASGHLKKSVGLLGCAVLDRYGVTPRFGFNLVDPVNGILYGKPQGEAYPAEVPDLGNFSRLPLELREHAIAS